ncbi:MAG: hypothetical protein HOW73_33535 [Polyangiaceae bacterium]|nr:hypothetical protein [Polyangiaceae bacterium]
MSLSSARNSSSSWTFVTLVSASLVAASAAACGDDDGTGGAGATGGSGGAEAGAPPVGGAGGQPTTGGGGQGGDANGGGGNTTDGGGGEGGGCVTSLPVLGNDLPALLSETGLYADIDTDTVADYVRAFEPKYPLWSDGAEKRRWIYIPECSQIDTTDMDTWQLPVGTRVWKEFTRDGIRVETRIITRTGPGDIDYEFGTYVWDDSGDAVLTDEGLENANGTEHDVPPKTLCTTCHRTQWRILGFSALQLTHNLPGETIASLSDEGLLTVPNPDGIVVPGDEATQAALGYMHGNCGNCHYAAGIPNISMHLRLLSTMTSVETTETYVTAVNQPTTMFPCNGCDRIEPGNAAASAVIQRMGVRGAGQMPPIATELVDDPAVTAVTNWINSLPAQ